MPPYPQTEEDSGEGPGRRWGIRRPRWGLIIAIIVVVALMAYIAIHHATGAGGPGFH
jgi:hypothetical protein